MSEPIYTGAKPPEANVAAQDDTNEDLARRWDRAMRKAFKGMVLGGRPTARRTLLRAMENVDAS